MVAKPEIECNVGETFQIGDCITVKVMRMVGNAARIGIDAPKGMTILRRELVDGGVKAAAGSQLGRSGVAEQDG